MSGASFGDLELKGKGLVFGILWPELGRWEGGLLWGVYFRF